MESFDYVNDYVSHTGGTITSCVPIVSILRFVHSSQSEPNIVKYIVSTILTSTF